MSLIIVCIVMSMSRESMQLNWLGVLRSVLQPQAAGPCQVSRSRENCCTLFRCSGKEKRASESWREVTIMQSYLLQRSGHSHIHTIKYQSLSIWCPNKGSTAVLHQNECGFHFPEGKQHNEESGGLMILANNSAHGQFEPNSQWEEGSTTETGRGERRMLTDSDPFWI